MKMSKPLKRKGAIVCILCGKVVKKDQKKYMLPVERPVRLDFTVHRRCFRKNDEKARKMAVKQHLT
jgi:hypothetical protein